MPTPEFDIPALAVVENDIMKLDPVAVYMAGLRRPAQQEAEINRGNTLADEAKKFLFKVVTNASVTPQQCVFNDLFVESRPLIYRSTAGIARVGLSGYIVKGQETGTPESIEQAIEQTAGVELWATPWTSPGPGEGAKRQELFWYEEAQEGLSLGMWRTGEVGFATPIDLNFIDSVVRRLQRAYTPTK